MQESKTKKYNLNLRPVEDDQQNLSVKHLRNFWNEFSTWMITHAQYKLPTGYDTGVREDHIYKLRVVSPTLE